MTAILLAAGKGERMWPITSTRPKPLVEILCEPLIKYHLEAIAEANIGKVAVVVHSHEDLIRNRVLEITKSIGLEVSFIKQSLPLGTGHAVLEALEKGEIEGKILVIYGDIFLPPSRLKEAVRNIAGSSSQVLAAAEVSEVSRYGVLEVDKNGMLQRIIEKPSNLPAKNRLVNAGIFKLESEYLLPILKNTQISERGEIEVTSALEQLAKKSELIVSKIEGEWMDVGTPWDLLKANEVSLREICTLRRVPEEECILFDEEKITIEDPVVLRGPVFIRGNVELGPCSHIREYSIICGENKIGFSVQIKNSIIMRGAKVPHLNYVGDSIIGEGVNLGAGTITANVRHDGKNVKSMLRGSIVDTGRRKFGTVIGDWAKTGINTSILPGVKIGARAWINAGCIVNTDVPDNSLLTCEQGRTIIERQADGS
ncbi:MAG: sugar phosphate nucleotidyltransferase [Fervidicoccaceae archaeon]